MTSRSRSKTSSSPAMRVGFSKPRPERFRPTSRFRLRKAGSPRIGPRSTTPGASSLRRPLRWTKRWPESAPCFRTAPFVAHRRSERKLSKPNSSVAPTYSPAASERQPWSFWQSPLPSWVGGRADDRLPEQPPPHDCDGREPGSPPEAPRGRPDRPRDRAGLAPADVGHPGLDHGHPPHLQGREARDGSWNAARGSGHAGGGEVPGQPERIPTEPFLRRLARRRLGGSRRDIRDVESRAVFHCDRLPDRTLRLHEARDGHGRRRDRSLCEEGPPAGG